MIFHLQLLSAKEDNVLYSLENSLPYILNRVGVRIGEFFSRSIEEAGVTLPMYRVLASLYSNTDQRLRDLSVNTSIEVSTLSRLIGEMKRKGLVSRTRLSDNGRTVAINLTSKGRSLADELRPIAIRFEEVAGSAFDAENLELVKRALNAVYEKLQTLEQEMQTASKKRRISRKPAAKTARPAR